MNHNVQNFKTWLKKVFIFLALPDFCMWSSFVFLHLLQRFMLVTLLIKSIRLRIMLFSLSVESVEIKRIRQQRTHQLRASNSISMFDSIWQLSGQRFCYIILTPTLLLSQPAFSCCSGSIAKLNITQRRSCQSWLQ